jgi:UDP-N-acetylmuramate-alanine ligase
VKYIAQAEGTIKYLLKTVKAKDTVATLGAGSIYKIGEEFLKQLTAGKTKK